MNTKLITWVLVLTAITGCIHSKGKRATQTLETASTLAQTPETETLTRLASFEEVVPVDAPEPQQLAMEADGGEFNGMTLVELEEIALANNPTLLQAQARVDAACGRWLQSGLRPNPVVGYSSNEIGNEGAAGQHGVFVGQQFITHGKLGLNRQVESKEVERVKQLAEAQRLRVLSDVRLGYYDVLINQRRVEIASGIEEISETAVRTTDELLSGEQATRVSLLQAEIEAESARVLVVNATQELDASWRRLTAVIGMPDLPMTKVYGELDCSFPVVMWDETLERLRSQSPEIAAAIANIDKARWALRRACVESKPNVSVQLGVNYDDSTGDPFSGVQASIPVPFYNRNQGGIRAARAAIVLAEQDIARVELDLQNRFAAVYKRLSTARERLERYETTILPKARETLDLVNIGYKSGEENYPFLAVLTAQRTLFNAQLVHLESLREIWATNVEIDGLLLTESLNPD